MGALFGVLIVGWLVAGSVVLLRRGRRTAGAPGSDGPARLLALGLRCLSADRAEWGRAMTGELTRIADRRARWRFARGCLGAALFLPSRRAASGRPVVGLVLAAVVGCVGLVATAFVRYPGLRAGGRTWLVLAVFLAVLTGYAAVAAVVARRGAAAMSGLAGGLAVAAVWVLLGFAIAAGAGTPVFAGLLPAIPVASLAVGAAGTWRGRTGSAGRQAAILSAVVAGLALFLVWVGDTLATAGRPYDPGLVRDFQHSGAVDLATYAVNDNLGAAMSLLLMVPVLTAALGCAGATAAARIRRPPVA